MKRRFKNIETEHVYFDVHDDGVFRSINSRTTYSLEEAENSIELEEISESKHSKDMTTEEIISTVRRTHPIPNNETHQQKMDRLNARRCGW